VTAVEPISRIIALCNCAVTRFGTVELSSVGTGASSGCGWMKAPRYMEVPATVLNKQ
jgi:hypothetical protein